ncbi:MAG TPA: hypothetical protein VMM36_06470 [Opitutaceae bacterium]|nr:hypothetical protein [Opitutaceae bacterium]
MLVGARASGKCAALRSFGLLPSPARNKYHLGAAPPLNEQTFDPNHALTIQLLQWIADQPRPYSEAMEVWRTSCQRLSIWEDALAAGLIDTDQSPARVLLLSKKGSAMLVAHWRRVSRPADTSVN